MPRSLPLEKSAQPDPLKGLRVVVLTYAVPITVLIMALLYSTRLFIVQQGEALTLNAAAQPVRAILGQFHSMFSWQAPTPFYVLWLHFWLRITGGEFFWLRIPTALVYLAGLCMLARASYLWAKEHSATMLLLLAAFWPYGFHYGSLLTWYSVAFALIAGLTWAYLSFEASGDLKAWYIFCILGLALLYVSAIGWAVLILLCVDDVLRKAKQESRVGPRWLGTFAFLAAGYAPLWPRFVQAIGRGIAAHAMAAHLRAVGLNAVYSIYVLPASESIAPWRWRFGAPMAAAILAVLVLTWMGIGTDLRRFLVYAGVLLAVMDMAGVLRAEELMLVAPWFLLPLSVALPTIENRYKRRALLIALLVIGGLGWYGIYDRDQYATGNFYEPWPEVAGGAGVAIREGGDVISNNPQFFFYLTYSLQQPSAARWRYVGSLPETVRNPHIWDPAEWEAAGRPLRPYMLWVRSTKSGDLPGMGDAGQWLDQHCGGRLNRYIARDPAYPWGQSLWPQEASTTPWLIETHQYTCDQSSSDGATQTPSGPPAHPPPTPAKPTPPTSNK